MNQNQLKILKQNKSREEIAEELQDQRGELDTDIEKIKSLIDNCHNDQLESLQKTNDGTLDIARGTTSKRRRRR